MVLFPAGQVLFSYTPLARLHRQPEAPGAGPAAAQSRLSTVDVSAAAAARRGRSWSVPVGAAARFGEGSGARFVGEGCEVHGGRPSAPASHR